MNAASAGMTVRMAPTAAPIARGNSTNTHAVQLPPHQLRGGHHVGALLHHRRADRILPPTRLPSHALPPCNCRPMPRPELGGPAQPPKGANVASAPDSQASAVGRLLDPARTLRSLACTSLVSRHRGGPQSASGQGIEATRSPYSAFPVRQGIFITPSSSRTRNGHTLPCAPP